MTDTLDIEAIMRPCRYPGFHVRPPGLAMHSGEGTSVRPDMLADVLRGSQRPRDGRLATRGEGCPELIDERDMGFLDRPSGFGIESYHAAMGECRSVGVERMTE